MPASTTDPQPEQHLIRAAVSWTILRMNLYAEVVVQEAQMLMDSGALIGLGEESAGFVAREDLAAATAAVLVSGGHAGAIYDITGPELLTYRQCAAMAAEISGRPIDYVATSDDGMYAMFDALGIPREPVDDQIVAGIPWNSDDMVTFEAAVREGFFDVISEDVERLTGRRPGTLRAMMEAHVAMLRGDG